MAAAYDALLLVSFGGPEGPEDVEPFLDNVLRGRRVPPERRREVAAHYLLHGGKSPINDQNRALLRALHPALEARLPGLRLYWGNRNWHPLLADTVRQMRQDGIARALALATSAFGSYSGCRQYREDLARARAEVGPGAPEIHKLRLFYSHPGFIAAVLAGARDGLNQLPDSRRGAAGLLFTAHSIPLAMAATGPYPAQLAAAAGWVAAALGRDGDWRLGYQSRSGPPSQPWLEPDVNAQLAALASEGRRDVVVVPIGFLSDHMEVVHDLDVEAREHAERLGLHMVRAATPGARPELVDAIVSLVAERMTGQAPEAMPGAQDGSCVGDCCLWARAGEETCQADRTRTALAPDG
ncbi:MAG: ferrochelatase [Terriglobales bacterium]